MRLKNFRITRYGPVSGVDIGALGPFNLFCGPNEEGKTLVLEALVRLLFGKTPRDFRCFERVGENPSGAVVIEDSGKDYEFPNEGSLSGLYDISGEEFRNIFVIRNSDLAIVKEEEFYTGIADRLTGLKTEQIAAVKRRLLDIGKLTAETKSFRNIKEERLFSRVREAEELLAKGGQLLEELNEKDFDELGERKFRAGEKLHSVEEDIELIQKAREREKYEKGVKALSSARESMEKLRGYEGFCEEGLRAWSEGLRDIERIDKEKSGHKERLSSLEAGQEKLDAELRSAGLKRKLFEEKSNVIEEKIKPLLRDYNELGLALLRKKTRGKFFDYLLALSAFLLVLSAAGLIPGPGAFSGAFAVFFLVCTIVFSLLKYRLHAEDGRLAALLEEIKNYFAGLDMEVSSYRAALSEIQKFSDGYKKLADETDMLEKESAVNRHEISRIKDDFLPAAEKAIAAAEEKIHSLSEKSRVDGMDDYREKLKEKEELIKSLAGSMAVLSNEFGAREGPAPERLRGWEEDVSSYREYRDSAAGVEFDRVRLDGLLKDKDSLRRELEEISGDLEASERAMRGLWDAAKGLLAGEGEDIIGKIPCNTSGDLKEINGRLAFFMDKYGTLRDDVITALEIFDEIDAGEREKISDLFGEESPVSEYFSRITSGKYENVLFERETGGVVVQSAAGELFEPGGLSGGAYDQLYLSVRLALAESLLRGRKGFFIMDDPFIKADSERLSVQMKILKELSGEGWQVLYFTAKEEVKSLLSEDIEQGRVFYFEASGFCAPS